MFSTISLKLLNIIAPTFLNKIRYVYRPLVNIFDVSETSILHTPFLPFSSQPLSQPSTQSPPVIFSPGPSIVDLSTQPQLSFPSIVSVLPPPLENELETYNEINLQSNE